MKAAIIEQYGGPEEFKVKDLPDIDVNELKDGQLLIQNKASSVNPVDALIRQGKLKLISGLFGDHIIGSDFSGTVLASKSNRFKTGDDVFGFVNSTKGGAYAEQMIIDEDNAGRKPVNISFTEAAALPLASITALQGLINEGKLEQGGQVIINGCTGGVGTAAVQIAKNFNAHVMGVCSSKNFEFAKSIGCDEVIDYETQGIPKDRQFDLFFDASGNLTISDIKENLKPDAMFVTTRGGMDDLSSTVDGALDLLLKKQMKLVMCKPNTTDLNTLKDLVETEKLKPYVAQAFPLEHTGQAHELQEKGGVNGKVAIYL